MLTDFNSIDSYIQFAEDPNGQVHAGVLLELLLKEPWQKESPHYDIVVTGRDLYDEDSEGNPYDFVIGSALPKFGAIISTNRFSGLEECIVTMTMHEVGHIFGLVPETRTRNVEESLGLHCTNQCIMRQGTIVPHHWMDITRDRLRGCEFCRTCLDDVRGYFTKTTWEML